jgi:XTP/dITP diphosphohydrolase
LLTELAGSADRRAAFKTVAIVVWPDGSELHVEGICPGVITTEERGDIGFGYDSVFQPDEGDGATFAEMGLEAKNAISHRGRAFRALLSALAQR